MKVLKMKKVIETKILDFPVNENSLKQCNYHESGLGDCEGYSNVGECETCPVGRYLQRTIGLEFDEVED